MRNAELFLLGRDDEVLERLERRMQAASEALDFEAAALYRDQIRALRGVRQTQFVASERSRDVDIVALVSDAGVLCVNLVTVRGGLHRGDKSFFPDHAEGYDEAGALEAFLSQHYLSREVPPLVLINREVEDEALAEALSEQAGHRVQISSSASGERRAWLSMAETNARLAIEQRLHLHSTQEARLASLQEALGLPASTQRIECFDISHTFGEATVASCVVWDEGGIRKAEYRHYNIQGVAAGDDYGAMREVLDRRYRKVVAGEGKLPDLILIDGGKGQVSSARSVLEELGLGHIALIGVAKGEERKPGLEQIDRAGARRAHAAAQGSSRPASDPTDPRRGPPVRHHRPPRPAREDAPHLHAREHCRSRARSGARRLLARFGGLKGLTAASIDELQQVEGVSRALAERIYRHLH